MKKINKLHITLEKLEKQKKKIPNLQSATLFEFIKYKKITKQTNKLIAQIQKIHKLEHEINFWYNEQNNSWIENPNINCKKYARLEKRANYKKKSKLYKIGIIEQKPLIPIINDIYLKIQPHISKISSIPSKTILKLKKSNFVRKTKNLISNKIPNKIDSIAINSAKKCIKHYKKISPKIYTIQKNINNMHFFKYINTIKNKAISELENTSYSSQINNKNNYINNYKNNFRESLRVSTKSNTINTSQNRFYPSNSSHLFNKLEKKSLSHTPIR